MKTIRSISGYPDLTRRNGISCQKQSPVYFYLFQNSFLYILFLSIAGQGFTTLKRIILITTGIFYIHANAQTKGGIEQYNYFDNAGISAIIPVVHLENKAGWHGEARYNYEAAKTFSCYIGKSFSHNGNMSWSVTPMGGVLLGDWKGGSVAVNLDIEYKKIFLSSLPEYVVAGARSNKNFFYNWTELGCNIRKWLFIGCTGQQTIAGIGSETKTGVMAGLRTKNFTFPIYYFDPLKQKQVVIVGINWEWSKS